MYLYYAVDGGMAKGGGLWFQRNIVGQLHSESEIILRKKS